MFKSEFLVVKNCPNTGFSQTVPKDGFRSGKPPARVCCCANKGKILNWAPAMRCCFSFVVGGHRSWSTMKFPREVVTAMASEFCVSHDIIRRIWKRAVENFNDPDVKQFCASPQNSTFVVGLTSGIVMNFWRLSKQCPAIDKKSSDA